MDRAQILEDLKAWADAAISYADEITPEDLLEKIDQLEELYE